jgi:ATP-binding cassette subfamily B protein/subfamily B ATP-binding cassette protein MsbA
MISWQLTLLFLIMVPIAGYLLGRIGRTMKQATRKMLERVSNIYRILQEVLGGIKVVKAYTTEPRERMRFREATRDYYNRAMRVVKIDSLTGPAIEILGVAAIVLALMAGSYLVLRKQTSFMGLKFSEQPLEAEALLQLYVLLAAIADPVRKLSSVFTKIQAGGAAADRIFECLDREPRIIGNSDGPRLARSEDGQLEAPPVRGSLHPPLIEFRDVCFSYDPGRPILSHMSFKVHRGETIAIVGGNGSGKSTLLSLLPRFRDPDHGSVMILGHDLRSVNLRSLRHNLGLVSQDIVLFDDTIHGNIAYGARGATREQVEQAATRAFAHDFITRLAQGYDTPVGECGGKLSGGQKQRICLARAILRDPAILLLDEFTSQTDAESETLIHRAMADFVRGRTTFMITHRMHTLEMASRIMVLDHGHIVAFGTEEELLRVCPVFQRLSEPGGELHAA